MKAILTFHSIDDSGSVLSYSPELFDRLLRSLDAADIPVVDLGTLLEPGSQKGVALTFDDGMHSVLENALPIMVEHAAKAHLFVTTSAVGTGDPWPKQPTDVPSFDMLSWDDIEHLHDSGVFIDAHTATHPDMRTLDSSEMSDECEFANEEIGRRLGRRPEYFAYPFGYHNRNCRTTCGEIYKACVTTELRSLGDDEDPAALPRLDSYYLQSPRMLDHLNHPLTSGYLRLRWALRTLRGTHCTASSDSIP